MESQYWERFLKTGEVADYLGYKMELYGHRQDEPDKRSEQGESDYSDRNGATGGTYRRV